jgi:hypothetical protein
MRPPTAYSFPLKVTGNSFCIAAAFLSSHVEVCNSFGSFASFTALLRASSRVSRFVCSFEHLAAQLENRYLCFMDREQTKPDHICLSCGQAMHLVRTFPKIGALPELRIYDCKACGVVFTESVGAAEWRESVGA